MTSPLNPDPPGTVLREIQPDGLDYRTVVVRGDTGLTEIIADAKARGCTVEIPFTRLTVRTPDHTAIRTHGWFGEGRADEVTAEEEACGFTVERHVIWLGVTPDDAP
jgi:hypothetical protein